MSAWKVKNIDGNRLSGISFHPTLCVAVDGDGNAVVSTNPTSATPTWTSPALIDPGNPPLTNGFEGFCCPASKLCVAVDNAGQVVASSDPAGGVSKWKVASVDPGNVLEAISCPTATFCVALDRNGNSVS